MSPSLKYSCLLTTLVVLLGGCQDPSDDAPVAQDPSDNAPVARWMFDEGEGTKAFDFSGNRNTAYIHEGAWGKGKTGNALLMDGGDDGIVTVSLSDSLRSTAETITVMGWAYRTAEHNVALVSHGYPQLFLGFHGPQFKWQLRSAWGIKATCYADKKYRAALNQWFHIAGTYNGRTARLYVNGEQICSDWLWLGGAMEMPEVDFTLSGYQDQEGNIVDEITGRIDDVRIYNRVLDAGEIQAIYRGEE